MENTEITIATNSNITLPDFKSPELAAHAKAIELCVSDMQANANEIAVELGKVLQSKCYEADGYDSVGDFAEQVFGIKRSQAYRMAAVASKFYLSDAYADRDDIKSIPLNNLAELNSISDADVIKGFDSGKLTADSKQADIRQYAKEAKGPKILKGDTYDLVQVLPNWEPASTDSIVFKKDLYPQQFADYWKSFKQEADRVIRCKDDKDGNPRWIVVDTESGTAIYVKGLRNKRNNKTVKKASAVKTTPGAAVAAAIEKYKAEHDGAEPDMATLLSLLQ